jgi:hypothetical protein
MLEKAEEDKVILKSSSPSNRMFASNENKENNENKESKESKENKSHLLIIDTTETVV